LLVVEDNAADVFLIREAIREARLNAEIQVLNDGEKAIQHVDQMDLNAEAPTPDLILLDLNLPRKSGREVLRHIRDSRRLAQAKVLVVTSSDLARDGLDVSQLGVAGYFRKPTSYAAFLKLGEHVSQLLTQG
jgi:CheY-like chemotaxis protein